MTTIETRDGQPVVFEHAVEMAEYLCALDFGLDLIAKEERATPQSVADLFCTCFLHWETDYRQQQGFTEASYLYPIFGGYSCRRSGPATLSPACRTGNPAARTDSGGKWRGTDILQE